jgi:hypothetical protein
MAGPHGPAARRGQKISRRNKMAEDSREPRREEPEVFAGRSIGGLIGGRLVRVVYKEEKLQQNVFPRFKQAFQAHGCDEVGNWWDLLCAILFGGKVSLQGPKYINQKTYHPKTMRVKFMRSHRDLVDELITIVFNEQANIQFRPISQPTSFKEIQGSFKFDTSTAMRQATIVYWAVDKQPDDLYRVIIHGEGKENLFTHTFQFQPSQLWISARYQTGAVAPAGRMGTSDEDSSVGAGEDREDACAGDEVRPVGESRRRRQVCRTRSRSAKVEGHEAAKPQAASPPLTPRPAARRLIIMQEVKAVKGRLQGSASDEVRRRRPVDDSDDDEARTPLTRSRVGPLGVGPLSGHESGGGLRRRQ